MPKGTRGETCAEAIRQVIKPGEVVGFTELFGRIRERGTWNNSTIWQHLMSLVVNLPPARHHWPHSKPFLFLHADGRYELYKETGYESYREKTLEALEAQPAGLCEECLQISSRVSGMDNLRRICEVLQAGNLLEPVQGKCSNCRRDRALMRLKRAMTANPQSNAPVNLTRDELIEIHLRLGRILDQLDSAKIRGEGFSSRVIRLRETDLLPGNIACLMLTLNGLRNMTVHEQFIVGPHEVAVVRNAMAAIDAWESSSPLSIKAH